jgi:site-specific recombinase XerD
MAEAAAGDDALPPLIEAWLATLRSGNTRAAYRTDIGDFVGWCAATGADPLAFSADQLAAYTEDGRAEGAGNATLARRLSAIGSLGAYTHRAGATAVFPDVTRPTADPSSSAQVLDDTEARALLDAADAHGRRSAALVRLLMLEGLKVGEVVAADAANVSGRPPRMSLRLPRRTVTLHADTAVAVHRYLARRRTGPLVLSERRNGASDRLTRYGVDYVVKEVARGAGIGGAVSGNVLRRRFVMDEYARGADLETLRDTAGHAGTRTTRRYLGDDVPPLA